MSDIKIKKLIQLYQSKQYDAAEKLAKSLTKKFPKHPFAWKVLGALLGQAGRTSEALNAFQNLVSLTPQDTEAHYNLGLSLKELGRLDEAEKSFKQAILLNPNYANAFNNLGITVKKLGRLGDAEKCYRQAILLNPNSIEAYSNLGNTLKESDRLEEAEANYRQAILLNFNYSKGHSGLGGTLQGLGRLEEAEASISQAIKLDPNDAEAYYNLGLTLQGLGRLEEAEASLSQAITLDPNYAEAFRLLSIFKKFNSQDEQYLKMQELYLDENITEEQRCHINFGLARVFEDLGNFKQAFIHYSEGNKLRKKLLNYDIDQDIELFKQIKSNHRHIKQNTLKPNKLEKSLKPIFIVGMPRSGTTLVEQIISSHPQVTGAGELSFAANYGRSIARGLSEVNYESLLNFRREYLTKLQHASMGNSIVTDKMPHNFLYIGLLAAAFPEAKIVHVKRNAAALCWGNFKQYFPTKNIGYCYALGDVISYYKLYENLMEFWENSLGKRIYNLDYELLTVKQENETRNLIDYLDLDWDDKVLSPQNNSRIIMTASNAQVRKKVYQGSSQQWKKYELFLDGAFDVFK